MAQLLVTHPNGTSERYPLSRVRTTIGRSARSDVCIPDAFASRLHAEVRHEGDGYWLHDLGSANGTKFNGVPVKENAFPMHSGGEIQIGETKLIFEDAATTLPKSISATFIAEMNRDYGHTLLHREVPFYFVKVKDGWAGAKPRTMPEWSRKT